MHNIDMYIGRKTDIIILLVLFLFDLVLTVYHLSLYLDKNSHETNADASHLLFKTI